MIFYVLSILLCVIFIIYLSRQLFKNTFQNRPILSLDRLKSGDLVFMAGNLTRYNPNIVGIEHTHCGMIWVKDGQLMLIELTSSGDWPACNNRAIVHPLSERLDEYNGYMNVKSIDQELNIPDDILNIMPDKEFDTGYTTNFLRYWLFKKKRAPERWCCTEFVYSLLVELGELDYDDHDFHDSFRFLSGLGETKNRRYSDFQKIKV